MKIKFGSILSTNALKVYYMKKLLYIDDEEINLQLFKLNFRNHYNIYTSDANGDILDLIKNEDIKVVITDYKMPIVNGMQLIEKIKVSNPSIICLLLSGYLESDIVTDKAKLFGYITKPYTKREVLEIVESAFQSLALE